jgi:hypothetical protein
MVIMSPLEMVSILSVVVQVEVESETVVVHAM